MLIPGKGDIPGFDVIIPHFCGDFSMRRQRFAYARLSHSYMTRLTHAFSQSFTTRPFRQAAYGCLKPPPTGLAPKGQSIGPTGIDNPPSSFVQHDAFPHLHVTIAPIPSAIASRVLVLSSANGERRTDTIRSSGRARRRVRPVVPSCDPRTCGAEAQPVRNADRAHRSTRSEAISVIERLCANSCSMPMSLDGFPLQNVRFG